MQAPAAPARHCKTPPGTEQQRPHILRACDADAGAAAVPPCIAGGCNGAAAWNGRCRPVRPSAAVQRAKAARAVHKPIGRCVGITALLRPYGTYQGTLADTSGHNQNFSHTPGEATSAITVKDLHEALFARIMSCTSILCGNSTPQVYVSFYFAH